MSDKSIEFDVLKADHAALQAQYAEAVAALRMSPPHLHMFPSQYDSCWVCQARRAVLKSDHATGALERQLARDEYVSGLERALRDAIKIVERELPPAPEHSCRPDGQCDTSCAEYFYASQELTRLRAALTPPTVKEK